MKILTQLQLNKNRFIIINAICLSCFYISITVQKAFKLKSALNQIQSADRNLSNLNTSSVNVDYVFKLTISSEPALSCKYINKPLRRRRSQLGLSQPENSGRYNFLGDHVANDPSLLHSADGLTQLALCLW